MADFYLSDELEINTTVSNMNMKTELNVALEKCYDDSRHLFKCVPCVGWNGSRHMYNMHLNVEMNQTFRTTDELVIAAVLSFLYEANKLGVYIESGKYNYNLHGDHCLFRINEEQKVYSRELERTYTTSDVEELLVEPI